MLELIAAFGFVLAIAVLEHRYRRPVVRLAFALSAFVVLGLSQPPPFAPQRTLPQRPEAFEWFCTLRPDASESDRWFCSGYHAAADRVAKNYWIGMPTRLAALAVLVWLFAAPAVRDVIQAGAGAMTRVEPPREPGDGAA